ncbi:hypothetical protein [Streptomyces sp. NPDC101165]|uniref:hypothetical protein n=1 Tax=Streptomyces sp. NPDC101165 TaxID=3366119 RepID=UPI003805CE8A
MTPDTEPLLPVERLLQGARVADVTGPGSVTDGHMPDWFAEFAARTNGSGSANVSGGT